MVEGTKSLSILSPEHRITASQLAAELNDLQKLGAPFFLLDVRPAVQFSTSRLTSAVNFPIEVAKRRLDDIVKAVEAVGHGAPTFVLCRRGNDSQIVAKQLLDRGVVNVRDLVGGMTSWSKEIDACVPVL